MRPSYRRRAKLFGWVWFVLVALLIWLVATRIPGWSETARLKQICAFVLGVILLQILLTPVVPFVRGAHPLPAGQEEHFLALAADLDVDVRSVRAYPGTERTVADAMFLGVLPGQQHVLVCDRLLDRLAPRELDAVVVHELAHAKGHDVAVKLLIGVLPLGLFALLPLTASLRGMAALAGAVVAVAAVGGMFTLKGVIGIKLEEHADDVAARVVGCETLASALDALARLNGVQRSASWFRALATQHPALDKRIERLGSFGSS